MKKLLALVLALVMTLGLATVGANAASVKYADASDITYKEAVDVMSEIGVLGGDETGFRPTDTLKRSEGAKIIAYLVLGNKAAEALSGTGTKFTDVPANHWAAGYIEYLASAGVLGGKGNGIFDPDGDLTTTQFAKMLLVALGYDATIEGFGGSDWAINVQKVAVQNGLFSGNSEATGTAAITREEAALYSLNTLKTPLVEYENKGNTINTSDGTTITFGASNAKYVSIVSNEGKYDYINNATVSGSAAKIVEFAEQYYSKLRLQKNQTDAFGRPSVRWTYDGKKIGDYTTAQDLLYTNTVKLSQIYADLGLTQATYVTSTSNNPVGTSGAVDAFYINGKTNLTGAMNKYDSRPSGVAQYNVQITKDSSYEIGGPGAEIYVYYDDGLVTICEINWYVGEVTGVYAASGAKAAYIDITSERHGVVKKETTGYEVGDKVVYTLKDGNSSAESVQKAETVTGTMTTFTERGAKVNGNLTVDGTKYEYSKYPANMADSAILSKGVKVEVTLDKYGYAIDVEQEDTVQNYAIVKQIMTNAGDWGNATKAQFVFTDGATSGTVDVNSIKIGATTYTGNADIVANGYVAAGKANRDGIVGPGDIVEYSVRSNGKYDITLVGDSYYKTANDTEIVTNGDATMDKTVFSNNNNKVNGKTVFVVLDSADNYTAYVGIANAPTVVTDNKTGNFSAASYVDGGYAKVVYIDASKAYTKNSMTIFVAGDPAVGKTVDDKIGTYWEYGAYIDGQPAKLKVDQQILGYHMYESIAYNSNDIASLGNEIGGVHGTTAEKNGSIGLGGAMLAYAKDVKVFYINEEDEIVSSSIKGIPTSENYAVWYNQNASDDVNYIFWQKTAKASLTNAQLVTAATAYDATANSIGDYVNTWFAYNPGGVLEITDGLNLTGDNVVVTVGANEKLIVTGGALTVNQGVAGTTYLIINGEVEVGNSTTAQNMTVTQGTVEVNGAKASLYVTGTFATAADGHVTIDGGAMAVDSTGTIAGASIELKSGSVAFGGKVTVTGRLDVKGGQIDLGDGLKVNNPAAVVTVSGGTAALGEVEVANGTLNIEDGTVEMGTLTIASTGTVTVAAASDTTAADVANSGGTLNGAANIKADANEGVGVTVEISKFELTNSTDEANTLTVEGTAESKTYQKLAIADEDNRSVTITVRDTSDPNKDNQHRAYAVVGDTVTFTVTVSNKGEEAVDFPTYEGAYTVPSGYSVEGVKGNGSTDAVLTLKKTLTGSDFAKQ